MADVHILVVLRHLRLENAIARAKHQTFPKYHLNAKTSVAQFITKVRYYAEIKIWNTFSRVIYVWNFN